MNNNSRIPTYPLLLRCYHIVTFTIGTKTRWRVDGREKTTTGIIGTRTGEIRDESLRPISRPKLRATNRRWPTKNWRGVASACTETGRIHALETSKRCAGVCLKVGRQAGNPARRVCDETAATCCTELDPSCRGRADEREIISTFSSVRE